jgi:hypothetical protein
MTLQRCYRQFVVSQTMVGILESGQIKVLIKQIMTKIMTSLQRRQRKSVVSLIMVGIIRSELQRIFF